MYLGQLVEVAGRDQLFDQPGHPYTVGLMAAVPVADPAIEATRPQQLIVGEVPSVRNPPPGCRFHPRCVHATHTCETVVPALRHIDDGRQIACHLFDESLVGE
jgi:oligopeptide transport system ATP-binding protein